MYSMFQLSVVDEKALNGVHLLSLQKLNGTHVLIRFENYLPDTKRQVSLKVRLCKFFSFLKICIYCIVAV